MSKGVVVKEELRKGKKVNVVSRQKTPEEKQADIEARLTALEKEVAELKKGGTK